MILNFQQKAEIIIIKMKKVNKIVILSTAFLIISISAKAKNAIELQNWQISNSGSVDIQNISEISDWSSLEDPKFIKNGSAVVNSQYNWVKASFNNSDDMDVYGIYFPELFMYDKVYVNGCFIGEMSKNNLSNLVKTKFYVIPPFILKAGKNEVLIQLGYYKNWFGSISKNTKLVSRDMFLKEQRKISYLTHLFHLQYSS